MDHTLRICPKESSWSGAYEEDGVTRGSKNFFFSCRLLLSSSVYVIVVYVDLQMGIVTCMLVVGMID